MQLSLPGLIIAAHHQSHGHLPQDLLPLLLALQGQAGRKRSNLASPVPNAARMSAAISMQA